MQPVTCETHNKMYFKQIGNAWMCASFRKGPQPWTPYIKIMTKSGAAVSFVTFCQRFLKHGSTYVASKHFPISVTAFYCACFKGDKHKVSNPTRRIKCINNVSRHNTRKVTSMSLHFKKRSPWHYCPQSIPATCNYTGNWIIFLKRNMKAEQSKHVTLVTKRNCGIMSLEFWKLKQKREHI